MLQLSKLLSVACALAMTACAAQPQGQYQPPPRPQIDPLPADLALTEKDWTWCPRLLQIFSASPQIISDSCGTTSASSSASKPAAR